MSKMICLFVGVVGLILGAIAGTYERDPATEEDCIVVYAEDGKAYVFEGCEPRSDRQ